VGKSPHLELNMDYRKRLNEARENMNRAENELRWYALIRPREEAEYARLSEAVRQAQNEFIDTLEALAIGVNESTKGRFAADARTY
jgi:hypothetical protein